MKELLKQFNDFFGKDAHMVVETNNLKITIGNQTLEIALPTIVGTSSKAPLLKS